MEGVKSKGAGKERSKKCDAMAVRGNSHQGDVYLLDKLRGIQKVSDNCLMQQRERTDR